MAISPKASLKATSNKKLPSFLLSFSICIYIWYACRIYTHTHICITWSFIASCGCQRMSLAWTIAYAWLCCFPWHCSIDRLLGNHCEKLLLAAKFQLLLRPRTRSKASLCAPWRKCPWRKSHKRNCGWGLFAISIQQVTCGFVPILVCKKDFLFDGSFLLGPFLWKPWQKLTGYDQPSKVK